MTEQNTYPVLKYLVEYDSVGGALRLKAKFLKETSAKRFAKIQKNAGTKNVKLYLLTPEGFKQKEIKVR